MATNEFTKKLRAAIKTKIQELGIDVDDELPDYIMIMIANKKDKARMKSDLMLFLSDNTEPFVDWLFDFFEKVNKKETEEAKAREPEKPVAKKRHSSEERERPKSRSRSPVRRSRSRSPRRTRHDDDKPKRAPIRAPSPKREKERSSRRRHRSRSDEGERKGRRRDDRKRITYSDEEEEDRKTVKSHVVPKSERAASPKLSSQVVVKRRKADPVHAKAGSSLFKRAVNDTMRDEEQPRPRRRVDDDVLQVNTARTSHRTVMKNDDASDISDEEPETQFIVKLGKNAATRKAIFASMDEAPPGDENYAVQHAEPAKGGKRKRRAEDPVLTFLKLSGVRPQKRSADISDLEAVARKRLLLAGSGATLPKQWNGKIEFDDDEEEEEESDNEAEIDAFLASAHDPRIPPTEALSRPLQYIVPQKKQFGAKAPEVGKIAERCRFWPKCRNEESCLYSHPSKPCGNFPNCWFGDKCLFIHPQCKFEPNCNKAQCPYVHSLPRPPAAPRAARQPNTLSVTSATSADSTGTADIPSSALSQSPKKPSQSVIQGETTEKLDGAAESNGSEANGEHNGTEESESGEKSEATETADSKSVPDIPLSKPKPSIASNVVKPLNMSLQHPGAPCRFAARCHNEACTFRHPKRCRFDEACTNESCYFWHPKKNAGRFVWTRGGV